MTKSRPTFDLHRAFLNKQAALDASFLGIRDVTRHPTTMGDQLEADWTGVLSDFLPTRYAVGPIFAVDHEGSMSEQIDVAVYDKHFSPQWFGGANNVRFVPVESVYAVFEVKPKLNSTYIKAARKKAASVRRLKRTSAFIVHAGGRYERKRDETPIIAGILTNRTPWTDPKIKLSKYLTDDRGHESFLDIGIAMDSICFDYTPTVTEGDKVTWPRTYNEAGQQLIHFIVRLFRQLQSIGTVPAIDMELYERAIRNLAGD
ncbi:DUF6602 domain-containing protein [Mycobacterium paraintracellulare]|uniref:DUF6602 domain-containing protein n=1 Tax=Mycobacterium avium complex (MAC) TaxID=120793 RepID=UPI001EEE59D5|nr:DUF6602 domain-containing protein [Mycobacterium paraintracellulare]WVL47469.1 DUF6602 domain-containing protein [Mycobacterium paraintracellulare]